MAKNWQNKKPNNGEKVGEFLNRIAVEIGVDKSELAVLGEVGDCIYELSDDMPVPQHPYLVIRTFAS